MSLSMSDEAPLELRPLDIVPLTGRTAELAVLDVALARAIHLQAPQWVTVTGALGMGKSRLCREWCRNILGARAGSPAGSPVGSPVGSPAGGPVGSQQIRVIEVAAPATELAGATPDPFALIGALLRRRFGLDGFDGASAALKICDELHRVFADRRVAEVSALLGTFLGFPLPDSPLAAALAGGTDRPPERTTRMTDVALGVLARFLERDAALSPLVLVLEDLHEASDRSLDLMTMLAAELADAPIVIVATAQTELFVRRPGWGTDGNHTRLDLPPLARREIEDLMRAMLADEELVPALVDRAVAESGGNPSLLQQLLRVYRQYGILTLEDGIGWMIDLDRVVREAMVITPEEAANKRISALSHAERALLGRGATFGETFWTGGLVALGRLGAEPVDTVRVFAPDATISEIQQMLGSLRDRGYLVGPPDSSVAGEIEWRFKQPMELALVRAGVAPALMRRRKVFAAQWLESHLVTGPANDAYSDAGVADRRREERFTQLGELYQEGGDPRRAAYCFLSAGALARPRLPVEDALALYVRAIGLLDVDDAVAKIDALHAAGDLSARLGRTREAIRHFQEMLRLAWWLDLPAKGGAAHDRLGRLHGVLGQHGAALGHLQLARELFEIAGDLRGIASTLDDIGRIQFLAGAPEASLEHHRAALVARERLGDDRGRALTLARLGQVEHETGALGPAGTHFRAALALRRRIGDRQGEVCSLLDLGGLERDLGQLERALALLDEGRGLAREIGDRLSECSLGVEIGDCRLTEGRAREALVELRAARELARTFGAKHLMSEATRGIAEAELALGRSVEARNEARAAFEIADKIGAPPLAGAALRVAATSVGMGAPGDPDLGGAREMFDRAIEILGDAGAEMELGRTLSAYADFEERTGRTDAAAELRRQTTLIIDRARRPGRTRTTREMVIQSGS